MTPPRHSQARSEDYRQIQVPEEERQAWLDAARDLFGFESLLPGQAEIMHCVAQGEDVLAILPTGGGKSLIYQLPALRDDSGCTLVISPLIALMKDQLDKLPRGVAGLATSVNSTLDGTEVRRRLAEVSAGRCRLIYAAPERLRQQSFLHHLNRAVVRRIVVDEAHCVSLWGHDFRPDYLCIAEARRLLGNPPLLGLTATAPSRVRQDILRQLGPMRVVVGEVIRSNLRLEVLHAENQADKLQRLLELCEREQGAGIVYCTERSQCEGIAALLRERGVSAIHYHALIDNRAEAQEQFMSGQARVVVATIAFGMGIDKADIRFIVHVDLPSSLEAYYQEAGRAGRDGKPARCLLMFAPEDGGVLTSRAKRGGLSELFVSSVYSTVSEKVGLPGVGRVILDDLRRDLMVEETPIRVALSLLEEAGLLKRWPDIPRSVTLRLTSKPSRADDELRAFAQAGGLREGIRVELEPLESAQAAGLDPRTIEGQLWDWSARGLIECRDSARDLLIELLPPPRNADGRIRGLLDKQARVQRERAAQVIAYARTRRCRHGFIGAYLGCRRIRRCAACDNCSTTRSRAGRDGAGNGADVGPRGCTRVLYDLLRGWSKPRPRAE